MSTSDCSKPGDIEDAGLLAATALGDREAFGRFVSRHQNSVYRYACLLTRNETEAEDILQETFLKALAGADGFRDGSARYWLMTIARRVVIRTRRLKSGEPAHLESLDILGQRAGWGDRDAFEALDKKQEIRKMLVSAMSTLTLGDRAILTLRDLEGFTSAEAAALLETTTAAVKSRLHRARLRLAAALRDHLENAPKSRKCDA